MISSMISSRHPFTKPDDQLLFSKEYEAFPITSKTLFQVMGPLLDVFLFVKNIEGRFIAVNRAFHHNAVGTEEKSMLGKIDEDFFPIDLARKFMSDDKIVFETGEPLLHRIELIPHTDLSIHWYETNKFPVFNSKRNVVGLVGTTHRISGSDQEITSSPEINRALAYLRDHFAEGIELEHIARHAGLEPRTLNRRFARLFHLTPVQFLRRIRLNAVCQMLIRTDMSISEISYDTGFCDQSHLNREFIKTIPMTPLQYRKRYRIGS